MSVHNDGTEGYERQCDMQWEYRKGGPNDPNDYYDGYSDEEEPTSKQIEFAEKLADEYDIDLSEIPFTKADYAEFIETFKDM